MKKKHHKIHKVHVTMHKDGSHTTHLEHEDGPAHDIHAAHSDHDSMMDHLMEHTSAPNSGEAEADQGQHGVEPPAAAAAGLPTPGPAAGA
jgi:hypothetical protein